VNAGRDAPLQEPPGPGFAWRVHADQDASTGVDTKASIILALETALLFGAFAAEAPHRVLGKLSGRFVLVAYIGIVLLILAAVTMGTMRCTSGTCATGTHTGSPITFDVSITTSSLDLRSSWAAAQL
jgi:hypothetical protein